MLKEKNIRLFFDVSLVVKGVVACAQIAGGVLAFFLTEDSLFRIVRTITADELAEDPRDFLANFLVTSAQLFSTDARHFIVIYLLIHGIVKLWLVIGLYRQRLWYYPTAIIIFGGFALYQIWLMRSESSLWLIAITAIDIILIALTVHEYRFLKSAKKGA